MMKSCQGWISVFMPADDTGSTAVRSRIWIGRQCCSNLKTLFIFSMLYADHHYDLRGEELRRVVLTDGCVLVMDEDAFQKRIEEDRARFGASAARIAPNHPK